MAISEERRAYNKQWVAQNQDKVKANREKHRDAINARRRAKYRQDKEHRKQLIRAAADYKQRRPFRWKATKYGVDETALELLFERGCAICGCGGAFDVQVQLHVDHDHITGKFRGVICSSCNLALGHFKDNPGHLIAAAHYLMNGGDSDEA